MHSYLSMAFSPLLQIYCQVILPCLQPLTISNSEKMDTNAQWFHSSWSILLKRVNIRVRGFHLVFFGYDLVGASPRFKVSKTVFFLMFRFFFEGGNWNVACRFRYQYLCVSSFLLKGKSRGQMFVLMVSEASHPNFSDIFLFHVKGTWSGFIYYTYIYIYIGLFPFPVTVENEGLLA